MVVTASSLLDRMAAASRRRAALARARESEGALLARASSTEDPPAIALTGFDVIAELKLRSPALGTLASDAFDPEAQLRGYAQGGAAAVSVLTEPEEFKGELAHLDRAAALLRPLGVPVMRKDFLTEPYQILEARAAGAGGVLVIAAMLDDREMEALVDCAQECGLFVLLEAFDDSDLARISELVAIKPPHEGAPLLVGVNSRNLRTLAVEFERFGALAPRLPAGLTTIAESGIETAEQIRAVARLGYGGALVGSALMRTTAPSESLAALIAAGREARDRTRACS